MRKVVVIIGMSMLAGVALAGGGIVAWRSYQHQQEPQAAITDSSRQVGLNLTEASGLRSVPLDASTSSGKTVSLVDNGSTSKPAAGNTTTVPSPDKFGEFDQYKSAEHALFGEIKLGSGPEAAVGKTVSVNYKGWLTNGKEFDESYSRGKPISFVLGQHKVISGWEESIIGMKVGGQRILIIPPAVGYGDKTTNGIPAGSVLVFEVEVVGVE